MSPEFADRSGNHMATNVRSERLCVACNSMLSAAIIHALDTRARAFLIAVYMYRNLLGGLRTFASDSADASTVVLDTGNVTRSTFQEKRGP